MSQKNVVFFDTKSKKKKKSKSKLLLDDPHNSIPWVEKYRPQVIDDIIVNDYIRMKINNIINDKSMPNLIITGSPGTGKTSTVLCIAKKLLHHQYDEAVLELNASDDRGLNMINNNIMHFCKKKMDNVNHKIIILDEADSITSKAQNLLNNIIEAYVKNTRYLQRFF